MKLHDKRGFFATTTRVEDLAIAEEEWFSSQ